MMFMMPMPPTSSEMPTMPPITTVTFVKIESIVLVSCSAVWIWKSSAASSSSPCAARNSRAMRWITPSELAEVGDRQLDLNVGLARGCPAGSPSSCTGRRLGYRLCPKISPLASRSPMIFQPFAIDLDELADRVLGQR
jgi:hypothetical protein